MKLINNRKTFLVFFLPLAAVAVRVDNDNNDNNGTVGSPDTGAALPVATDNNAVVDGSSNSKAIDMMDREARLRGSQALQSTLTSLQKTDFQYIPDIVDFPDLSSDEKIEKVHELQSKLNTWVSKLTEVEMMAVSNGVVEFTSIIRNAQSQLEKVEKPVNTILQLLNYESIKEQEEEEAKEDQAVNPTTTTNDDEDDDGDGDRRLFEVGLDGTEDRSTWTRRSETTSSTSTNMHREQRAQYRRMFEEQRQRAKTLHKGHEHEKLVNIQQAIHNGDHASVKAFTDSVMRSHYARFGKRSYTGSRAGATAGVGYNPLHRRLNKAEMCFTLVGCASRMSRYDMFVYFYSDDIDSTTGEVDDNVVLYDEKDLMKKYNKIKKIVANADDPSACDDLLQEFHRTKENGNVPSWEGASVGQVCLAEGTTNFVKLEDAARVLHRKPEKLVKKVLKMKDPAERREDLKLIFQRTINYYPDLVSTLAVEPVRCAEQIWTSKGQTLGEPFPFGKDGNAALDWEVDDWEDSSIIDGGVMDYVRFPTFKGKDAFPNLPPAREIQRRKMQLKEEEEPQSHSTSGQSANTDMPKVTETSSRGKDIAAPELRTSIKPPGPIGSTSSEDIPDEFTSLSVEEEDGQRYSSTQQRFLGAAPRYTITLERIHLIRESDGMGSAEELFGHLWASESNGGQRKYLWNKGNSGDHWSIDEGRSRWINARTDISTTIGIKLCGRIREDDRRGRQLGNDDYGERCSGVIKENIGSQSYTVDWNYDGSHVRTYWKVYVVTAAPTPNPTPRPTPVPTPLPTPFPTVSLKLEEGSSKARDDFGQIRNNQESPYNFVDYPYLLNKYKTCGQKLGQGILDDLDEKDKKKEKYDLAKILKDDFFDAYYDKCLKNFFSPMREGIEMVFGDRTSTGFICGMKQVIVNGEKEVPGSCCLDAPYELEGDDWGREYQCPALGESSKCKKYGPYFSGMSTQACDSYGGTWCPNQVDCSTLRDCIASQQKEAKKANPSFYDYLGEAPKIKDPTNFKECGKTREYFGFDEYFSNDAQVCEDIEQLRLMKDFSFLDEFYGGGDGDKDSEKKPEPPEFKVPETKTIAPGTQGTAPQPPAQVQPNYVEPDYSVSSDPVVQNGIDWENAIFSMEQVLETTEMGIEISDNVPCPDLPLVGTFPCDLAKSIVKGVLLVTAKVTGALLQISEFMMKVKATIDNILPIKEAEQMEAETQNTKATGVQITTIADTINWYIYDSFEAVFKDIQDKDAASNKYLAELDKGVKKSMVDSFETQTDYIKEVSDQQMDTLLKIKKDCSEVKFDMQIEILSRPTKSFLVITTGFDGKPIKPDFFEVKKLSADGNPTVVSEVKDKAIDGPGMKVITMGQSAKEQVFIVTASLYQKGTEDELATKISTVSFLK